MDLSAGIVVGRKTERNRDGALPVRILQVMITDMADVQNVQLVGQAGEECNPPDGSLVLINSAGEAFKLSAGTADTVPPIMGVGGKRIYSTDAANENVMAEVRLHPDGAIEILNAKTTILIENGVVSIQTDNNLEINSAKTIINNDVDINGVLNVSESVTSPNVYGTTDVVYAGKSAKGHYHGGVAYGSGFTGTSLP